MNKVIELWYKMDELSRLGIGCGALYLSLYVIIDILEVLTGVLIG